MPRGKSFCNTWIRPTSSTAWSTYPITLPRIPIPWAISSCCARSFVRARVARVQLLYVAGPAGAEGAADAAGRTGKAIGSHAANDLCRYYAAREGVQTKILRVPFLYTASAALEDPFLVPLFDACSTGSVALQGAQDVAFPLLCAEELAVLVRRIFDSWDGNFETLDVADTFHHTAGEVGDALKALFSGLAVAYGDSAGYAMPASDVARMRYGWFQRYDLLRDLSTIQARWDAGRAKKVNPLRAAIERIQICSLPIKCLETALPGRSLSCWSICSPNRPSSTCSIIACSTWC